MREIEHLHAAQLEQALSDDDAFAKIHESARGQAKMIETAENAGDQLELLGLERDDGFVDFLQDDFGAIAQRALKEPAPS